jgi:hypothetical protein
LTNYGIDARMVFDSDGKSIPDKIGILNNLTTTDKSNLVNALNEHTTQLAQIAIDLKNPPVPLIGMKLDGVTDDSSALQALIKFCFDNNKNLTGVAGTTSVINNTVYIPYNPTSEKQITLDFKGMTFQLPSNGTLFQSGVYSNGTWTSTLEEAVDVHDSFGVTLKGFTIEGGRYGIRINNWHQGCIVKDIGARNCQTVIDANNPYYCHFDNINTIDGVHTTAPYVDTRFIFRGQCNLMKISRMVPTNANVGYSFQGGLTGVTFEGNSVEGCQTGAQFTSYVYDISISGCYIENLPAGGIAFDFQSYVYNAKFSNNYFNFINTGWYAINYVPLPANNIIVEADNQFNQIIDNSYIFKPKDNTTNYNNITLKMPPKFSSTPSDLLIDNTKFSNQMRIDQELNLTSAKARVINKYAVGNYAGQFSGGFAGGVAGCTWVNNSNAVMTLNTQLTYSDTQLIYVNLKIAANVYTYTKGFFVGTTFYELTGTGISVTTNLAIATVGGFLQITSPTLGGTVTGVDGEVRLV